MRKPSDIYSLGFVSQVKVEEDAGDMSKEHMLLVDGWSQSLDFQIWHQLTLRLDVMTPLPPSQDTSDTPSLEAGSQSSQLDELFALTPPQQRGLLTAEKMGASYCLPLQFLL